ncbi:PD-(D/E)XK nuclease family protein [uncultured Mucilaginibacter sp.]|uniref:PDDEXK-like family protein n=1 Tax=uncultured Mucilaginibacter sp. TaxID=797541 RepID=UPI0025E90A21|nr:PD-(D/E)XK nuclease family protein [uncultured Mucilaginibacter sp.]
MEDQHIKNLLNQVLAVSRRYEKINELSGENFNLFKILKMESSEVRLHSAFLGEMLNPKGSHGQKDVFLKLFLDKFQFKNNAFDTASAHLEIEKHAGFLSNDGTEGGRIDLIIEDRNRNHIIIENKIYAEDQKNQMLRYFKHSPTADLFYLTLDGKEPTEYSKNELKIGKDFQCLSYMTDIIDWLESCRKEVSVLPIIRETISQYINLIKLFTNQTINDAMKQELSNIIISNLEASFLIANNLDSAAEQLLEKLEIEVEAIAEDLNLGCHFNANLNKKYTGFSFEKEEWESAHIVFQFSEYGERPLKYGICAFEDPQNVEIPVNLRTKVAEIFGTTLTAKNNWWLYNQNMPEPFNKNWNKSPEPWIDLNNGRLKEVIKQKVAEMLDTIGDLTL